jgi:hypothetical protein
MVARTAQIVISVDDKSLVELNTEIKSLQTNINGLKVGTAEWIAQNQKLGILKQKYQESTESAKKLQGQLQKITGSDQIRAVSKLGTGMVGAFAAANNGLGLLTGNKAFDALTAKATTLMATMGGLNQISELFSRQTMSGLASIGSGFKGLISTVKGFSTATKAALISTGIGALIAGLGLVIANWDKIKGAINGGAAAEKKAFEDGQKSRDEIIKSLEDENKVLEEGKRLIEEANKYLTPGRLMENEITVTEQIKKQNELLDQQLTKYYDIGIQQAKDIIASEEKITKLEARINELKGGTWNDRLIRKNEKELQTEKLKLEALIEQNRTTAIQIGNLESQKVLNKRINDDNDLALETNKQIISASNEKIKNNERQLVILNSQKDAEDEIYNKQKLSLELQQNKLMLIPHLTEEEAKQLGLISAQLEALKNQNNQRLETNRQAKIKYEQDLKDLKTNRDLNIELADMKLKYIGINEENKKRSDYLKNISDSIEFDISIITDEQKRYEAILSAERKLNEIRKVTTDDIVKNLRTELAFFADIQDKTREKLEIEKSILENQYNINDAKIQEKEEVAASLRNQLLLIDAEKQRIQLELKGDGKDKNLSTVEKQAKTLELQGKIYDLEIKGKEVTLSIVEANNEITDAKNENAKASLEIEKSEYAINKTITDSADKTQQITAEVEKQLKLYSVLQNFVANYGEEISTATRSVGQSMELMATLADNRAAKFQETIDGAQKQMDILEQSGEEHASKIVELQNEQKDANGELYDQLQAQIDLETIQADQKREEFNKQAQIEAIATDKKNKAEHQAAQWRKAAAIIDATIQGALAVIKALPNVILSVAVGTLAAAGIATIAAEKIPEAPKTDTSKAGFVEGGFTGIGEEDEVAGIVHRKEYVVPARVVKSPNAKRHIAALESQRLRGYEQGGYVIPSNSSNLSGFDYEKFFNGIVNAVSSLPNPQVGLVAISNGLREVELTKQNAGLVR